MATIKELVLHVDDLQPYYPVTVKNADGTTVDLSGAAITCTMQLIKDGTLKIDAQSTGISIADDQVANKGQFDYEWQDGDTDTAGKYRIWFEVTPTQGGKFTIPQGDEEALVRII